MARSRKTASEPPAAPFAPEALDALIGDVRTAEDVDVLFRQMKKALMERIPHFPNDDAATKLLYLALRNIKKRWAPASAWQAALTHFAVLFPERFVPETRMSPTPHTQKNG